MSSEDDVSSGLSSPLTSLQSRTPSPSSSAVLPSPPSSQNSPSGASPDPENRAHNGNRERNDGPPPTKRRKLASQKPRVTQYLDLRSANVQFNQSEQTKILTDVLQKKRKIVVIAGAGISVSAGIPDFRSSNGLFQTLRKEHNLKGSGKQLFDASVYRDGPSTDSFHTMVRSLSQMAKTAQPTEFHKLLDSLANENRLLRLYTQNVDGLDTSLPSLKTSIPLAKKRPFPKTIQLHGGLDKMVCVKCNHLSDFDAEIFVGPTPPACASCETHEDIRAEFGRRNRGIGRLRPRMVLYNEHNPDDEAIGKVASVDLRTRPDAVIVVGTSLKVPGVRRIAREMCHVVRGRRDGVAIWINNDREPVSKEFENCWDLVVTGTSDKVAELASIAEKDGFMGREATEEDARRMETAPKAEVVVFSPSKQKNTFIVPTPPVTPTSLQKLSRVSTQISVHSLLLDAKAKGKAKDVGDVKLQGVQQAKVKGSRLRANTEKKERKNSAAKTTAARPISSMLKASKAGARLVEKPVVDKGTNCESKSSISPIPTAATSTTSTAHTTPGSREAPGTLSTKQAMLDKSFHTVVMNRSPPFEAPVQALRSTHLKTENTTNL